MDGRLLIGTDVGGTNVKYVVTTPDGTIILQGDIRTDPADADATFDLLAAAIRGGLGASYQAIGTVGLACAGIVDPGTGWLGRSPNLPGWESRNLAETMQRSFGPIPVVSANDVNAALYGEYCFGVGRGCRHLVMIALGTGVGGGVIVDGKLLTGRGHGAGEIGHMPLDLAGPMCACGNVGCLEAFCGGSALVRRAREMGVAPDATAALRDLVAARGGELTTRHLFDLAVAGDATVRRLFTEAGQRLGQAVSSLINVLAPERVIIGGGVGQAGDLLLEPCRAMIARHVMSPPGRETPLVTAGLGPHAAAMGAAALAAASGEAL
jgi:glucokinase